MSPQDGSQEFANKAVLITGGAGGLGSVAAQSFVEAGAHAFILDTNEQRAVELVRRLSTRGPGNITFIRQDLSDLTMAARIVRELSHSEALDILVNNAAIYPSKPFKEYDVEEYETVQRINASAAFSLCQAVLPGMVERKWGRIINVSSITFYGGWGNLAPYVISKGSLIGLTRAVAREYGIHGITSNAICPGAFPTEAEKIQGDQQAYTKFVLDHQSIQRRGTPEDFASALLFFCSERSGFITGQSLNVDGGWFMC